jgi:nitroreductase
VHIEVGHAAENILLQAVSLDLAAVPIGAFYDDKVKAVIGCSDEEVPLYIIPIGVPH